MFISTARIALVFLVPTALLAPQPGIHAAPRVAASVLITSKSIGPARLGMSVAALKRAFPGSVIEREGDDGPEPRNILKENGREVLYFVTRSGTLSDSSIVTLLSTSDPRFQLKSGIRPGSWFHNAVKIHGRPSLGFSPHGEGAIFPSLGRKIEFGVEAPNQPNVEVQLAGIYSPAQLKVLVGTTTRFRAGTRITSILCFSRKY